MRSRGIQKPATPLTGQRVGGFALAVIALALLFPPDAHAYFDPATGNVLVQVLVGVLAGIAVTIKLFWAKIMLAFHTIFGRKDAPSAEDE